MQNKTDRIIIDTNLWISFLIAKNFSQIDFLIAENKIRLIFSNELLAEFISVSQRPKFNKWFSEKELREISFSIRTYAEWVEVISEVHVCRDANDNFILALAKDSDADFILTGDNDLLALKKFGHTKILSIADYLKQKKKLKLFLSAKRN